MEQVEQWREEVVQALSILRTALDSIATNGDAASRAAQSAAEEAMREGGDVETVRVGVNVVAESVRRQASQMLVAVEGVRRAREVLTSLTPCVGPQGGQA